MINLPVVNTRGRARLSGGGSTALYDQAPPVEKEPKHWDLESEKEQQPVQLVPVPVALAVKVSLAEVVANRRLAAR